MTQVVEAKQHPATLPESFPSASRGSSSPFPVTCHLLPGIPLPNGPAFHNENTVLGPEGSSPSRCCNNRAIIAAGVVCVDRLGFTGLLGDLSAR